MAAFLGIPCSESVIRHVGFGMQQQQQQQQQQEQEEDAVLESRNAAFGGPA